MSAAWAEVTFLPSPAGLSSSAEACTAGFFSAWWHPGASRESGTITNARTGRESRMVDPSSRGGHAARAVHAVAVERDRRAELGGPVQGVVADDVGLDPGEPVGDRPAHQHPFRGDRRR